MQNQSYHIEIPAGTTFTAEDVRKLLSIQSEIARGQMCRRQVGDVVFCHGFVPYEGGRHVSVMKNFVRLAIITHPTMPDWN